jgi:Bacterial Ig domain
MRLYKLGATLTVALLAWPPALAQSSACRVEPFQGATLPQGAVAHMHVKNTGAACVLITYGIPSERRNPTESGAITSQPSHGSATFSAPQARYTPSPGFAGNDEFAFEASARGNNGQPVRIRVRVVVHVGAP